MGLNQAVRTCLRKYIIFDGRASRSEFWWFILFSFLVQLLVFGLLGSVLYYRTGNGVFQLLAIVVSLGLILPSLAVAVRRLHDVGHSGWWMFLKLVPFGIFVLIYWWCCPSRRGLW